MISTRQQGFTAVEVLITLFIAVLFVGGGYQIYGMVLNNGTESREMSLASNYAYQALREYADQAVNNCNSSANINMNHILPSDHGLASPNLRVSIDCPYGTTTTLKRITSTITYSTLNGQKKAAHAVLTR